MTDKLMEFHLSKKVPVFIKARKILEKQNVSSIEDIVSVIEELTEYENEIRNLRQSIFESTYSHILLGLIEPVNKFFEQEYESL